MNKEEFCRMLDTLSDEELDLFYQYLKELAQKYQKEGEKK